MKHHPAIAREILDANCDRFWANVRKSDACWEWFGKTNNKGYGIFNMGGVRYASHRVAYQYEVGTIPDSMVVDHLCLNPLCIRPDHLEAVSQSQNVLRGMGPELHKARAEATLVCSKGHPYEPSNIYSQTKAGRNIGRQCRECKRIQWRRDHPPGWQTKTARKCRFCDVEFLSVRGWYCSQRCVVHAVRQKRNVS